MGLRERLGAGNKAFATVGDAADTPEQTTRAYQATKSQIHQALLGRLDLEAMESLAPERLKDELRQMVERLLLEENLILNAGERRNLVRDIQYEMLGLGPLEPLLADPTVSDILVNTSKQVYVERKGRLELTPISFDNDEHLMKIIDKIVSRVGRRVDESSPMVDARLPDGSRVNAIIPPLAIDGLRHRQQITLTTSVEACEAASCPELIWGQLHSSSHRGIGLESGAALPSQHRLP
jgi:pilus assembly protein CpaF